MKNKVIILMTTIFLIALIFLLNNLRNWRNPKVNKNPLINIHDCIYKSSEKKKIITEKFEINYIENSPLTCVNPKFPSIHIKAKEACNAWVNLVHTDNPQYGTFIDCLKENYPFYGLREEFYDAPHWNYTLFQKPLSYWKAHSYALKLDQINKTIYIISGIEWGFKLSFFRLYPIAIEPRELSKNEKDNDCAILKNSLINYKITKRVMCYGSNLQ